MSGQYLNLGSSGNAGPMALTTPVRSIGAPFRPSIQRPVLCTYVIELNDTTNTSILLTSDGANPPVTPRSAYLLTSPTPDIQTVTLTALVLPGHWVQLTAAGSAIATVLSSNEVVL